MDLMIHEEMLEALELDVAGIGSVSAPRPANLLERTLPDAGYLLVVEPGEVVSSFAGDAKLALLDHDRGELGDKFFCFRRSDAELSHRLRDVLIGELFGSDHACPR